MAGEEIAKKPRARASLDGKILRPIEPTPIPEDAATSDGDVIEPSSSETDSSDSAESTEVFEVQLYTNKAHDDWYFDKNDNVAVLDDNGEDEKARQMLNPDSAPKPGYPKFISRTWRKEIPASGKREAEPAESNPSPKNAEPAPKDAGTKTGPEVLKTTDKQKDAAAEPEAKDAKANEDIDELIQRLQSKTPAERAKVIGRIRETAAKDGAAADTADTADTAAKKTEKEPQPEEPALEEKKPYNYTPNYKDYVGLKLKSVSEILADPTHQHFFGELLHTMEPNADDVLRRIHEDRTTPADETFLNYASKEYSKWDRAWSDLAEHMTEDDVELFKRRNKSMDNVIAWVGKDEALSNFKQMLRYLAMRDQKAFEHMEHALHHAHEVNHSMLGKMANKKIETLSARLGIERTEFKDVFDLSSEKAKALSHKKIEARIRNQAGGGRKMMDWLVDKTGIAWAGSSRIAADNAISDAENATRGRFGFTGEKYDALNRHLDHAAPLLDKVMGDESLRRKMVKEAKTNEKYRMGTESGPDAFPAAKDAVEKATQDVEKTFENLKKDDPKFAKGDAAYDRAIIDRIKADAQKKMKAGTGFWAWLSRVVFGTKFDKAATKATGRPVHTH